MSSSVEEPRDVSQQEFTFAGSIVLAESIITKTGEFKYSDWEVESYGITENKKIRVEWNTGNAIIAAKGISKAKEISIDIEEMSD